MCQIWWNCRLSLVELTVKLALDCLLKFEFTLVQHKHPTCRDYCVKSLVVDKRRAMILQCFFCVSVFTRGSAIRQFVDDVKIAIKFRAENNKRKMRIFLCHYSNSHRANQKKNRSLKSWPLSAFRAGSSRHASLFETMKFSVSCFFLFNVSFPPSLCGPKLTTMSATRLDSRRAANIFHRSQRYTTMWIERRPRLCYYFLHQLLSSARPPCTQHTTDSAQTSAESSQWKRKLYETRSKLFHLLPPKKKHNTATSQSDLVWNEIEMISLRYGIQYTQKKKSISSNDEKYTRRFSLCAQKFRVKNFHNSPFR